MNERALSPYTSSRGALWGGFRDAVGVPALVLFGCYVGFGSIILESGLGLPLGLFSTISAWALPGQVVMIELYSLGASVLLIALAVMMTNARLLPMVMTLIPLVRDGKRPRWQYYAAAHVIAVTSWIAAMKRCPSLPESQRLPYFVGFCLVIWMMSMGGTAVGFFLSGIVPQPVSLALVFLNPIYFMLILASDLKNRGRVTGIVLGALMGPLLHHLSPDWGLLITGVAAGSIGYFVSRREKRRG
ncbi:MAG: AzlC family ABC transporter permease [Rhodospirillales bacterium]|nr:AzlC family ABC transporter permease [Rhodospirillales bacterium]